MSPPKTVRTARREPPHPKPLFPSWLIPTVIMLVLFTWAGSIVWSASHPEWPIPPSVHAVVIAVITGVMGYVTLRSRVNGNGR